MPPRGPILWGIFRCVYDAELFFLCYFLPYSVTHCLCGLFQRLDRNLYSLLLVVFDGLYYITLIVFIELYPSCWGRCSVLMTLSSILLLFPGLWQWVGNTTNNSLRLYVELLGAFNFARCTTDFNNYAPPPPNPVRFSIGTGSPTAYRITSILLCDNTAIKCSTISLLLFA